MAPNFSEEVVLSKPAGPEPAPSPTMAPNFAEEVAGPKAAPSSCFIGALDDPLLTKIFTYLPPVDILGLPVVCQRWYAICQAGFTDIKHLDLSPLPSQAIGPLLRLLPRVKSIFARGTMLNISLLAPPQPATHVTSPTNRQPDNLRSSSDSANHRQDDDVRSSETDNRQQGHMTSSDPANQRQDHVSVTSLKLYDVKFAVEGYVGSEVRRNFWTDPPYSTNMDRFRDTLARFLGQMPNLTELVINNGAQATDPKGLQITNILPFEVPPTQFQTLTHLQLSGDYLHNFFVTANVFLPSLIQLERLECLILKVALSNGKDWSSTSAHNLEGELFYAIGTLKRLRELSLNACFYGSGVSISTSGEGITRMAFKLPALEVLVVQNGVLCEPSLTQLYMKHPALRILVLTGQTFVVNHQARMPARKFVSEDHASPLPLLHVFVSGLAKSEISFAACDASRIYVIGKERPTPNFLARPDIAPIFEGVWIARMVAEGAANGCGAYVWQYYSG